MSSSLIIGLEMSLVLGGVLAFGAWELWRLRRDRQRPPADGDSSSSSSSPPR